MSVLKGEGTHVILYGTYTLPSTRMVPAYFARPDRVGSYPAVVLVHDIDGLTPHVKAVARYLARHGLAVVCPDLFRGRSPSAEGAEISDQRAVADLKAVFDFIGRPGADWASADRSGLLGLGKGGRYALFAAPVTDARAVAFVDTPLGDLSAAGPTVAALGIYGADGDGAEDARNLGATLTCGEVVLYQGVGDGFTDDSSGAYEPAAAADALDRLVEFFGEQLGN